MLRVTKFGPFGPGILSVAAAVALAATFAPARAGWLTHLTGNTQMSESANSDGIVNFAVYKPDTNNWVAELGLGGVATSLLLGTPIDLDAAYVFFYQVVNTDPNPDISEPDHALHVLKLPNYAPGAITSMGFLSDTVFTDGAPVGPAGNRFLGTEAPGDDKGDDPLDGAPSESGVSGVGFASDPAAYDPITATANSGNNMAMFTWDQLFIPGFGVYGDGAIPTGGYSSIVFMTTDIPYMPDYGEGNLRNGDNPSDGDLPRPNPEPASLMLLAMAAPAAYWLRRRRPRA